MGPRRHEDVPRKGASPRGAPSRGQPRVPPAHLGRARGPGRARRGRATGGTPRHVAGSGVQPIVSYLPSRAPKPKREGARKTKSKRGLSVPGGSQPKSGPSGPPGPDPAQPHPASPQASGGPRAPPAGSLGKVGRKAVRVLLPACVLRNVCPKLCPWVWCPFISLQVR